MLFPCIHCQIPRVGKPRLNKTGGQFSPITFKSGQFYTPINSLQCCCDGGLEQLGMPAFKDVTLSDDALSLKAYLIDAANDDWEHDP